MLASMFLRVAEWRGGLGTCFTMETRLFGIGGFLKQSKWSGGCNFLSRSGRNREKFVPESGVMNVTVVLLDGESFEVKNVKVSKQI